MQRERLPGGEEIWRTARGEAHVQVPAPSVVLVTVRGHSTMELFPLYVREVERCIRHSMQVRWFGDYAEMTGYDSEVRVALASFTADHRDNIDIIAVLLRSRIVSMGVSVANMALGGIIEPYADRTKFERRLQDAVTRSRREDYPVDPHAHG